MDLTPESDDYTHLIEKPDSDNDYPGWNGPYLDRWPSKNPWGGTYSYRNEESAFNVPARYLELDNVPESAAKRIDLDLDGGKDGEGGNKGIVRYSESNGNYTVQILISADGNIDNSNGSSQ